MTDDPHTRIEGGAGAPLTMLRAPILMSHELREARENMARIPVTSAHDLFCLDPDEVMEGYTDALEGLPCGPNRSRAYWHGWRCGMIDAGKMQSDAFSILLVRDLRQAGVNLKDIDRIHRAKFAELREMGLA